MLAWVFSLLPGWAAGWLGGKTAIYLSIAFLFTAFLGFVVLRIFSAGKSAAMEEFLNAQIKRQRERIALKDRQLDAANRRPTDRDELISVFEEADY